MEVREVAIQHPPVALAFIEVVVENDMLFRAMAGGVPLANCGAHGMHVRNHESPSRLQHAEDFARIGFEVVQVALIYIRNDKIETVIVKEAQVLRVGDAIRVFSGLKLARGVDHRLAQVNTEYTLCSVIEENPAEASLAAPAVEDAQPANVATGA